MTTSVAMIDFPNFKKIELSDKELIEKHTAKFPCYSDFNFMSFWSWDTRQRRKFSILNKNLVFQFTDYITNQIVYSMIGDNEVDSTLHQLIAFSEHQTNSSVLKYIPETVANIIKSEEFVVVPDLDNYDHIVSTENLSTYQGNSFKSKRRLAQTASRQGDLEIKILNPDDINLQIDIFDTLVAWKKYKESRGQKVDMYDEQLAILRILRGAPQCDLLILTCAYKSERLVGFSIDEIVSKDTAISHYFKTDDTVIGLSEYLNQKTATHLLEQGILYWNWEQDLGLETLKRMKHSYRPIAQLRKYNVRKKI